MSANAGLGNLAKNLDFKLPRVFLLIGYSVGHH